MHTSILVLLTPQRSVFHFVCPPISSSFVTLTQLVIFICTWTRAVYWSLGNSPRATSMKKTDSLSPQQLTTASKPSAKGRSLERHPQSVLEF